MVFDIASMLRAEVYDHPVANIELIETHISWVILTGDFVYKIKKPVDFGFLDFSTLAKRLECCNEELRLNRRLAPAIYLEVVAVTGAGNRLKICRPGASAEGVVEYAVKMMQFPQAAQLDNMLAAGEIAVDDMDAIALMIAGFHQAIDVADETMTYGDNEAIYHPVEENFVQIREHLTTARYDTVLIGLQRWCDTEFEKLNAVFRQRKHDGFVRECHGDMHLRNLVWLDSGPCAFDCIEFNPGLRWIDVISDLAFLVMDLEDRELHRFARRLLNAYLEATGDYAGLSVLRFYLCYRALVRAKVSVLRLEQESTGAGEGNPLLEELESYLDLARQYTRPASPCLMIMRGMSASGKSTVSRQLVERLGAIRIRSDVERKRMFAVEADNHHAADNATEKINQGIYSKQASIQTYAKLAELAQAIISAGYSVIVDAAFLDYQQRKPFQQLAASLAVPYLVFEVTAPAEVLRERIVARRNDVSDADLTVLEHQLKNRQPLLVEEAASAITVDTSGELDIDALVDRVKHVSQ